MKDDPARWERIEALLDELLDLEPAVRKARLDALAGDAAALRPELERLLEADTATRTGILDRGIGALAGRVLGDDAEETPAGRRIGPYRVVRTLGRGGMGEVLLAERAEGDFEQRVALKIVRGGLDRAGIVERFRRERQILARLRHPHIAALYDGGATEDGAPYFAMEYVEGHPITEWCDARCASVEERVRLFESVCSAVQYAHRNLVVHRDLKPSNVFVTGDGTVKLLDFGIGKLLDSQTPGEAEATGQFLTPAYAAPEQILGEGTSTSSDVFSLGMLLYVLLTGHHPHGDTLSSVAVARAIAEQDPPDPSAVIDTDTPTTGADEIARRRGVDRGSLRRRLRGDLDNILAKALRKNPEERYASAEDLRADLERTRLSLPVEARAPTVRYRLRKFARRHRVATIAGAVTAAALIAGVGGVGWQSRVATQERDRANAVKDYLTEIFSAVSPEFESGETLTAVELVERGAERVAGRFDGDPRLRAEIAEVLGNVLTGLARYDRADSLLAEALEVYRGDGDRARVAATLQARGLNAVWRGDLDTAAALYEEALAVERALHGESAEVADALEALGSVLDQQGRPEEGETRLRDALRIGAATGAAPETIAGYRLALANCLIDLGRFDEAERTYRDALAALPDGGVTTGKALSGLASLLDHVGRVEEAEEYAMRAVRVQRVEYGAEGHPEVAIALSNAAMIVSERGRLDEAEALQMEALEILERTLAPDHHFLANMMNNISVTRTRRGDYAGAADLLEKALPIMERNLGAEHPGLLPLICNWADNLRQAERFAEAETAAGRAVALARKARGERHFEVSYALISLGLVHREAGDLAAAERALREAWEIRREAVGAESARTVEALLRVALLVERRGRTGDARSLLEEAIASARGGVPDSRSILATSLLGRAEFGTRHGEAATVLRPLLEEALAIREEMLGPEHPKCAQVRAVLEGLAGRR